MNSQQQKKEYIDILPNELSVASGEQRIVVARRMQSCNINVFEGGVLTLVILTTGQDNEDGVVDVVLNRNARINCLIRSIVSGDKKVSLKIKSNHKGVSTIANYDIRVALRDTSSFECEGCIVVPFGGEQVNARYEQHILNASTKAHIKTTPALEIEPSDVSVSHSSSVESWDEESMFYSETRGIDENVSKKIIAQGFLEKGVESIIDTDTAKYIKDSIEQELDQIVVL